MSTPIVYQRLNRYLAEHLKDHLGKRSLDRLSLLVIGIIKGVHAAPAQIAAALGELRLSSAQDESIERRIRRIENDPQLCVERCFYPLVRAFLERCHLQELVLVMDPTTQKDHLVLLSVNIWYRGRSLPLAWSSWPANTPLEGEGFWERAAAVLAAASSVLPAGVDVVVLADRAFGCPAFTDLVSAYGWHWIVRVQDQTVYQDRCGRQGSIASLVAHPGARKKLAGQVFKKAEWRSASVLVFWGRRHRRPLCLVSDLRPAWEWLALYRRRFPIECTFRDYKSYGWHWEQGQVRHPDHMERLLLGMALAVWLAILAGAQFTQTLLARPPCGTRRTRPWWGKQSLFRLGLRQWKAWLAGEQMPALWQTLPDWQAPVWSAQICAHFMRAFVFA